jgi:DNA-binding GntR family transcriptional regulator
MSAAEPVPADVPGDLLADSVHRRLQEEILAGALAPGTSLSVPALAARLAVSRSPVREAVLRLMHEGLAVHTPRAGARVATLDEETVRGVLEVREVLDGLAARRAAPAATVADLDLLRGMVAEQERLLAGPADESRDTRLDVDFHTTVRALARNAPLSGALQRLDTQAHLYRSDIWSDDRNRRLAAAEHRRIVDALEAGDERGAEEAARAHVAGLRVRMTRRQG